MKSGAQRPFPFALPAAILLALIGTASGALAAETEIRLTRHADKTYDISGSFTVDASTTTAWSVLSDYDHIARFVSSMRSSRLLETRADGSLLVEQMMVVDMFFHPKKLRILLEVRQSPGRLRFTDVGHQDFRVYDGDWEVSPITAGAGVNYHLLVRPGFFAPSFVMSRAVKRRARELLEQIRAEIVRRGIARSP